jgi:hypothetical protein
MTNVLGRGGRGMTNDEAQMTKAIDDRTPIRHSYFAIL